MDVVINDYLAGAVGGVGGLMVGHPFDTVKVQLQIQQMKDSTRGKPAAVWKSIRNIGNTGIKNGFYRGLSCPLASCAVQNFVFFGVYGDALKLIQDLNQKPSNTSSVERPSYREVYTAGCVGGFVQSVIVCPADRIKVLLQSQITGERRSKCGVRVTATAPKSLHFSGPIRAAAWLYRHHGIGSLFHGYPAMVLRDTPTYGVYMLSYEFLNYEIKSHLGSDDRAVILSSMLAGGLAGIASWTCAMPMDVIKSTLQSDVSQKRYSGILHCAHSIIKSRGVKGFFRGLPVVWAQAFPVNAVVFLIYSQSLIQLNAWSTGEFLKLHS